MGSYFNPLLLILPLALVSCGGGGSKSPDAAAASPANATTQDNIEILSVSPASVDTGVDTVFTVTLKYTLSTKSSGLVYIGFNGDPAYPQAFKLAPTPTAVAQGSGTLTVTASATPTTYSYPEPFQVYVNLSEDQHAQAWTPLALNQMAIVVSGTSPVVNTTQSEQGQSGITCARSQCAWASTSSNNQ